MASTEIFLVFPVYEDALNTPHYINKVNLKPDTYYDKHISIIDKILEVFGSENYIGYYDSDNIAAFLLPIKDLEDYYPNIKTRFRRLMSLWGENWRNYSKQEEADSFYYFCTPIKNDTFCEVTKRKSINDENNFLIINYDAFPSNKGDKVSVLMCGREDVPAMLNMAFGQDSKTLYYYDSKHKKYIEFKQELEQNAKIVYHAFHLDCSDENRIPSKIKSVIDDCFRE